MTNDTHDDVRLVLAITVPSFVVFAERIGACEGVSWRRIKLTIITIDDDHECSKFTTIVIDGTLQRRITTSYYDDYDADNPNNHGHCTEQPLIDSTTRNDDIDIDDNNDTDDIDRQASRCKTDMRSVFEQTCIEARAHERR